MAQRRPVAFTIIAIINFVAAAGLIGCGICSNLSEGKFATVEINKVNWDDKKLSAHMREKVPAYTALKVGGIATGYCIFAGLILSGVALLFGGMLGKFAALAVYLLGFLHHAVMIVIQLALFNPAINQFCDTIPNAIMVEGAPRELTRSTLLLSSYGAVSLWILGILYYLVAGVIIAISSPVPKDDDEKPKKKSKTRDADEDDETDEEEERPRKKRPKPSRDDDDDDDGGRSKRRKR